MLKKLVRRQHAMPAFCLVLLHAASAWAQQNDSSLPPELEAGPYLSRVEVLDAAGVPIVGARTQGSVPRPSRGQSFCPCPVEGVTDADGIAPISVRALGREAWIVAPNHLPLGIEALRPEVYVLEPARVRLEPLGEIVGEPLRMTDAEVVTFDLYGTLRHYTYSEEGVTELAATALMVRPDFSGRAEAFGDELWLAHGRERRIDVWSISDASAPQFSYSIEGFRFWQARQGPMVAARSETRGGGSTEIWMLGERGDATLMAELPILAANSTFVGDVLYMYPYGGLLGTAELTIVDLSDPQQPEVTYQELLPDYGRLVLQEDHAVLTPIRGASTDEVDHLLLDISNPRQPVQVGVLRGDGYVTHALSRELYVGFVTAFDDLTGHHVAALLQRTAEGIETVAVTEYPTATSWPHPGGMLTGTERRGWGLPVRPPTGAAAHPYYAFAGHVWRWME